MGRCRVQGLVAENQTEKKVRLERWNENIHP